MIILKIEGITMKFWAWALAFISTVLSTGAMAAANSSDKWQLNLTEAATSVMQDIHSFHNLLLVITIAVSVFVLLLLVWVAIRYNKSANKTPSKVSHNTFIEIIWTVVPVVILLVISVPSFRLLLKQQTIPASDLTIKVTGYQWYWNYEYQGENKISFDSYMIKDADIKQGQYRLLSVDNEVVVPVNKVVKIQTTAADVLHSFAIPAFGIKVDTVPGRLNETWFKAEKTGTFYGQCSELCGQGHAFMPIAFKVVSDAEYKAWVASKKTAAIDTKLDVAQNANLKK